MTRCSELHGGACTAELSDTWRCCPLCGRKTAAALLEGTTFYADPAQPKLASLRLRLRGIGTLTGQVTLDANSPLRCETPFFTLSDTQPTAAVSLTLPPLQTLQTVNLYLRTDNGARNADPDRFWEETAYDLRQHTLTLLPAQPGRLEIDEDLLIFRSARRERRLRLRNTGNEPLNVNLAALPPGYRITPGDAQFLLLPNADYALLVSLDERAQPAERETLAFQAGTQTATVTLCRERDRRVSSRLPRYVVGLDFGTRNSSAILRDMKVADPRLAVAFIPKDVPREPSFMYYSARTARLYFADKAVAQMLGEGPDAGIFIERLKEHLSGEEEPFLPQAETLRLASPEKFRVDALLERYLRYWHDEIDAVLRARSGGAEPDIHYVFSLPVLDQGPKYERHLQRMRTALQRAGFPLEDEEAVTFVPEPVAAALYFLIGKARNAAMNEKVQQLLSRAQLADGVPLVVVDSGGGTTDVVSGIARVEPDGKIDYQIEATLGLDAQERRFGGVNVTDDMYRSLEETENLAAAVSTALRRSVQPQEIKYQIVEPAKIYFNAAGAQAAQTLTPANFAQVLGNSQAVTPALRGSIETLVGQLGQANISFTISADLLETIIAKWWLPLEAAIRRDVLGGKEPDRPFVILVGGNTHVRALGQRCAEMFARGRLIDLSALLDYRLPDIADDDKMLAVAGGTVWRYGARLSNLTPYRTELRLHKAYPDGSEAQETLLTRNATSAAGFSRELLQDWTGLRAARLELYARYEGQEGRVLRCPLPAEMMGRQVNFYIDYRPEGIQILDEARQRLGEYLY